MYLGNDWSPKGVKLIFHAEQLPDVSPSHTSGVPHAGFESVQNLSSGNVKWSYAVVIAITSWCHFHRLFWYCDANLNLLHIETGVNGCLSFIFYNGISTS